MAVVVTYVVDLLYSFLAAILLSVVLHYCYWKIRSDWPASYQSLIEDSAYRKALRPVRYIVFRSSPIILAAVFGAVQLERYGRPVWLFGLLLWAFHTLDTNGRALWELRYEYDDNVTKRPRQALYGLMIVATFVLIQGSVLLAAYTTRNTGFLQALIPDMSEIVVDLWAGLIGAVLILVYLGVSEKDSRDDAVIDRIRTRIESHYMDYVKSRVDNPRFDFELFEAVMIAESLQRPRWFRILERLKGIVWKPGTYGVMQVRSDRPLNDFESIDKALYDFGHLFNDVPDYDDDSWYSVVVARLYAYNGSAAFVETVMEAYDDRP